jgi:hypothetical protein
MLDQRRENNPVRAGFNQPEGTNVDRLIALPLDDSGQTVAVFETDGYLAGGADLELAADGGGVVAKARTSLEGALREIRPAVEKVVDTVRALGPDKVEIEFGLKVGGETGVVIAKGTSEVNFVVRMQWKPT